MILVILFWILLLIWFINALTGMLPGLANTILTFLLFVIIGLRLFGNPLST